MVAATDSRRLTLLDSMALLGALALALALLPGRVSYLHHLIFEMPPGSWADILESIVRTSMPFLYYPALVLIPLRLRRPRPSGTWLLRQPGFVACCMVVLSAILVSLIGIHPRAHHIVVGGLIAGSWLILAVNRWWAGEASWLDRTGRVIGACWIGLAFLQGLGLYFRA
ncbi:MAG: hypothetical protein U0790_10995 [Isosphaeraceae bacterium]